MSQPKSKDQAEYEGHPNKNVGRNVPSPDAKQLRKPKNLGEYGDQLWKKLVPELTKLGIATTVDVSMLHGLCYWWQVYNVACKTEITDYSSTSGKRQLDAVRTAWTEYSRIARQFGLSAASRSQISVTPPSDDDELDEFVS